MALLSHSLLIYSLRNYCATEGICFFANDGFLGSCYYLRYMLLSFFKTAPRQQSVEDKILAMSDHAVQVAIPQKLRETGLFTEDEIDRAVDCLVEFRAQNRLDIIE